jgi:hypothetical protein
MSAYVRDRAWSERFIPDIKNIVGPRLLVAADHHRDTKQATDLLIFVARDMRIAARVRRPGIADRYPWDFTIRAKRDTGAETELAKIVAGFGDWMFYGHADDAECSISRWLLIDLHRWRTWREIRRIGFPDPTLCGATPNGDGTYFAWYDVRTFPRDFGNIVIASSHALPSRRYGSNPTFTGMDRR